MNRIGAGADRQAAVVGVALGDALNKVDCDLPEPPELSALTAEETVADRNSLEQGCDRNPAGRFDEDIAVGIRPDCGIAHDELVGTLPAARHSGSN